MLKKRSFLISAFVLLIASLACSQPNSAPPQDPNAINTSVVQTVAARQTNVALSATVTPLSAPATDTPMSTFTPESSPTPEVIATVSAPELSVSKDTNCRTGPGALYPRVGILLAGENVGIIGRDGKGEYWYIHNPDNEAESCWVWGKYATTSGNIFSLPYSSAPPVPPEAFSVSYHALGTCSAYWIDFKLVNGSDAVFRSISITVKDATAKKDGTLQANNFSHNILCGAPDVKPTLDGGETLIVSSPLFSDDLSGHDLNASITVCLEKSNSGTCLTREINFKP